MTAYITALYDRVKSTCIEQLYQASRAYTFWSLKNYNAFYDVLNLGEPDKIDASVISTGKATIIDKKLATIDKRSVDLLQDYPAEKNQIVGGIRIVLTPTTYSAVFDSLKKLVSVVTGVDKNGKIQIAKQYLAVIDLRLLPKKTWGDFRNIRVKRARVWMYGMQTTNNVHHIDFTHLGDEDFVPSDGSKKVSFTHKSKNADFLYDASKGFEKIEAIYSGKGQEITFYDSQSIRQNFTPFGPLALWLLAIDPAYNPGLNLTELEKIVLEFHIQHN